MIKDAVAINLKIIVTGSNEFEITQIGLIWKEQEYKCQHFHIENKNKHSNNPILLEIAFKEISKIIKNKAIILFNNQSIEEKLLKKYFAEFKIPFDNKIYDISKKTIENGIIKNNLINLSKIHNVFSSNTHDVPSALFKARQVFLIANKIF
ncbi:MAG: hypothetical protein ACRCW6_01710 [Mycoplasmoidaceae bacterium]